MLIIQLVVFHLFLLILNILFNYFAKQNTILSKLLTNYVVNIFQTWNKNCLVNMLDGSLMDMVFTTLGVLLGMAMLSCICCVCMKCRLVFKSVDLNNIYYCEMCWLVLTVSHKILACIFN